ncbi:hypothetical protein [Nocardia alni]|uniref:hypothetical protein n=1 Tax=Nocardia alni TaxID=2815723 RepID=UPI001C249E07|nr:hypothetical protein [Nocardia alni]
MLYYTRTGETIVIPSEICPRADLGLAHHQMQRHLSCRIDHCAWKWVAYTTLIHHGHVVPAEFGPLDRAEQRGLHLPATSLSPATMPEPQPFWQLGDNLDRLTGQLRDPNAGGAE